MYLISDKIPNKIKSCEKSHNGIAKKRETTTQKKTDQGKKILELGDNNFQDACT